MGDNLDQLEEINSLTLDVSNNIYKLNNTKQGSNSKTNSKKSENEEDINGWTGKNQQQFLLCLYRLKYYRIINNFFIYELKNREGRLSWAIIVISSFSSVLSLIATDNSITPGILVVLKWMLVFLTLITTLIGAYIKKQQFIERINNIDRYLQLLNQTVEDLNITFILEPKDRDNYNDFCTKYIPLIKNLSVSPVSFSPKEWKRTVYTITKYYPELICGDGTEVELLWPWFKIDFNNNNMREQSVFGGFILNSIDKPKAIDLKDYMDRSLDICKLHSELEKQKQIANLKKQIQDVKEGINNKENTKNDKEDVEDSKC